MLKGFKLKAVHNDVREKKTGLFGLIKEDIHCVFERDPAARRKIEVLLTYPGVHAIILHRISHTLWIKNWLFVARLVAFFSRVFTNIDIHPGATIGHRFFIDHGAGVVIGETAEIGNDVTLYHGVTLGGTSWNQGKRHPTLKDGVMIGAGAKILGPITLAEKVRVGANSVVIADVSADCTVVGIPGKVVQVREAGTLNPFGIDLNHHLIPDPVGKAISCMVDRMEQLEAQIKKHVHKENGHATMNHECDECEAISVCEPPANYAANNRVDNVAGGN